VGAVAPEGPHIATAIWFTGAGAADPQLRHEITLSTFAALLAGG
jgi:hypothetical protein